MKMKALAGMAMTAGNGGAAGGGGEICGTGQGACCAGSNDGCPAEAPICSEWGYCQCASYKPGDPECGPGFDNVKMETSEGGGGGICGTGQGACCAGSNDGCPEEAPVCSEWGYCQCASYKPGDPECGPGFDSKRRARTGRKGGVGKKGRTSRKGRRNGRKGKVIKGKGKKGKNGRKAKIARGGRKGKSKRTGRNGISKYRFV